MYSESRSFISDVLTDPVEGVLDCRWSKTLDKLLENIDRENKYLSECTSGLYQALQELENKTAAEGKILHFIFLTRQGVPVYWLLKGIYAKQGKKMPDSDILGINGGYKTNEIKFDSDHETGLKSLLRVDEKNILNVFIDETTSYGQTLNACFRLADNLGGNAGNYNWAVLFPIKSETAPWDIFEADESAYYPQTHPKFLSTHLYMSPKGDIDSSIASLPTLNQNYNSNICVSQIAHKLYDIGQNIV